MSFRVGLLLGALAASLTAALLAPRADRPLAAFVVLSGSGALALGPLLAGIAEARPLGPVARALLSALGLSAAPLAGLGWLLKNSTHHRPLGAVTFAFVAVLMVAFAGLVCLRTFSLFETHLAEPHRSRARIALGLLAALGPSLLLGHALLSRELSMGVTDAAIALGTGAIGLGIRWSPSVERVAHAAGVWVWLVVVLGGVGVGLFAGPEPAAAASPVLLAPFAWFIG